jgi:DNA-binding HxlR family transcriptional regulator
MRHLQRNLSTKRRKAILLALSKPKTYMEIKEKIGLSKNDHLTHSLQELIREGIIYVLTKSLREGKVYGLTERGKKLRKELMENESLQYSYTEDPNIDWNTYGWVVCGKQRKKILRSLTTTLLKVNQIRERMDNTIGRTNTNDVLKEFVRRGLAIVTKKATKKGKKSWVWYKLSEKGQAIKEQMLAS